MVNQLSQAWSDPHMRHAMLVHLPIVLGLLGVIPVLALFITRFRSATVKLVAIAWFAAASVGGGLAAGAGEDAAERVEKAGLTAVERAALEKHEELGEGAWIWPLIPAACVAVTFVPLSMVRWGAGFAAIASSVGVAVWIGATAHAGGELVYVHGLGVPARQAGVVVPRGESDRD